MTTSLALARLAPLGTVTTGEFSGGTKWARVGTLGLKAHGATEGEAVANLLIGCERLGYIEAEGGTP